MNDWLTFGGLESKLPTNFKGILSRVHLNFEEQNEIFAPSIIIIIHYCVIIIINSYSYNCINKS